MEPSIEGLLSKSLEELEEFMCSLGEPRFRARQLFQWIHQKGVFSPGRMGTIPRSLSEMIPEKACSLPLEIVEEHESDQGGTRKFVFRLRDGNRIESVLIPEKGRIALCLSTQVGCAMGCVFCRTARMGWKRDLDAGEIVAQYYAVRALTTANNRITHIVFMGMGEPLANYVQTVRAIRILTDPMGAAVSPRRITVSTVGVVPAMEMLLREVPVNLTVSVNAPDDELRTALMPVNRVHSLDRVIEAMRKVPLAPRERITVGYVMIKGKNDSPSHAGHLAKRLHGIRCKINLIPLNPFPSCGFESPSEEAMLEFQALLHAKGFTTTIRVSKGRDVLGACGQLACL